MAPKKKGRVPSGAASTPSGGAAEHLAEESPAPVEADTAQDEALPHRWTDEQETSLFKAMIRWKPVGSFLGFCWELHAILHLDLLLRSVLRVIDRHAQTFPYDSYIRTSQVQWS